MAIFRRKKDQEQSETSGSVYHGYEAPDKIKTLFHLILDASEDEIRAALDGDFSQLTYKYGTKNGKTQAGAVLMFKGNHDPYLILSMLSYEALVRIAKKNKVKLKATKEELIDDILIATFGEKRPDSGFNKMIEHMKQEQERRANLLSEIEKKEV